MLVSALDNKLEVLGQLVQTARDIAQVDNDLGLIAGNGLHQRIDVLVRLFQGVDGGVSRLQKVMPVVRLAQLWTNPQVRVVVTTTSATAKLANAVKHIGDRHARTCDGGRRLGSQSQVERRTLRCRQVTGNLTQRTGARPAQALKQNARFIRRDHARPLATRLALDGVGLVDYPVANRWQNPTLGSDIAEQQGVVRNDHIGMRRTATGTVDQAFVGEERA